MFSKVKVNHKTCPIEFWMTFSKQNEDKWINLNEYMVQLLYFTTRILYADISHWV